MTIERAAKAIEKLYSGQQGELSWEELAYSALEAIAEPTPEMWHAGAKTLKEGFSAGQIWCDMHAAMMKEGS